MAPCFLSKKTSDSYVTLLKDGPTINLPREQIAHGYSLGKKKPFGCLVDGHVSVL